MKIALAQINPTVGDFENNTKKILDFTTCAYKDGAKLIIFPELALCGYPPKDLLLKKQFIEDNKRYLELLSKEIPPELIVVLGFAEENKKGGKPLFNSLAVIKKDEIIATRQKCLLPTYDVFDEDRYFEPGKETTQIKLLGKSFGLSICEDIWHDYPAWKVPRYHIDPIKKLSKEKISVLINASASPYFIDKPKLREDIIKNTAKKYKVPIVFVNQVGGNDELIFDGNSCVVNNEGNVYLRLKSFEEDLITFDLSKIDSLPFSPSPLPSDSNEELLQATIVGVRDYVKKCGFEKVIIGLSGGIDSALVATIAKYALGKENIQCVFMPSRYTSKESEEDAKVLAKNLNVILKTIPIEEPFKAFLNILSPNWGKGDSSLTEENLQSRIRGIILMALSNQTNALVLSTGNKSELATGYCTLYGDMCGGLAVISDLPKTTVYKLAEHINKKEGKEIISKNIMTKAPTAELRPNQTDQDKLPPYEKLDKILNKYVEEHLPLKEIIKNGVPKDLAQSVCTMIDNSEYKRQQAAPGLKLTSRSFGYGWRMPIAKRYKERIE